MAAYVQDTDPGAVGALSFWLTSAPQLFVRNFANAAWMEVCLEPCGGGTCVEDLFERNFSDGWGGDWIVPFGDDLQYECINPPGEGRATFDYPSGSIVIGRLVDPVYATDPIEVLQSFTTDLLGGTAVSFGYLFNDGASIGTGTQIGEVDIEYDSLNPLVRHLFVRNFIDPDAVIDISGLYNIGSLYWMRTRFEGTQVSVRLWADVDPEPGTWLAQVGNPLTPRTAIGNYNDYSSENGTAAHFNYFQQYWQMCLA